MNGEQLKMLDDHTLLTVLAEKVETLNRSVNTLKSEVHEEIEKIHQKLDSKYVTQSEFWPIKTFVYGLIGIIGTAIITAVPTLIWYMITH